MALKMSDIAFKARLPEIPATLPVFALAAASLSERQGAIKRLGDYLKLEALRSAEVEHGTVMASARGDIHHFDASGAVLARDATAAREQPNEMRKWEGLERSTAGDGLITLNADAAKRLLAGARELLEPIGLLGRESVSAGVQLEQVAQLDEKGNQIAQGVGQATVKFGYAVEGVPACGAGAKTLAFADPAGTAPRFTGMFHAWRTPGKATKIRLGGLEQGLAAGLLSDPELELHHRDGHRITVTRIELVYLALPAFIRQSHLFPAFEIEGTVSEGKRGIAFNFGRFHHAAPPSAYAAADLSGPHLMANPDGIKPLPQRQPQA